MTRVRRHRHPLAERSACHPEPFGRWRSLEGRLREGSAVPRRGFTLWELTMVLLVMAIAATLSAPAFARLGTEQPSRGAGQLLTALQAARHAAFEHNARVTLRLDPKSLAYQADTSTTAGSG